MKVGILGAGQGGIALKKMLNSDHEMVVWFDNNVDKQGNLLEGLEIADPHDYDKYGVEVIWTGTLNSDSAKLLEKQIRNIGFKGKIHHAVELKYLYDIRLSTIRLIAEEIIKNKIPGDIAELGVYQGQLAKELNKLFPNRKLYLFDTFEGFNEKDLLVESEKSQAKYCSFCDTSVERVMDKMLYKDNIVIKKGYFQDNIPKEEIAYAFVSLDPDLYQPVLQGLNYFYPRLSSGGSIVIHDYNSIQFPGVKCAVDEYCNIHKLYVLPISDFHGTAILMKP